MVNVGTLTIEKISYYTEANNPEESLKQAEETAVRAILSEAYGDIRPCVTELLKELREAPESKRRNRCLALARRIAESVKPY